MIQGVLASTPSQRLRPREDRLMRVTSKPKLATKPRISDEALMPWGRQMMLAHGA